MKEEFGASVDFLLGSQFIKIPEVRNHVFQVVVGSGMGLLSSDEISNFCFYELVEKHVLKDHYKQKYGLKFWVRFKDDIFFVINAEHQMRVEFFHEIRRLGAFFIIKADSISKDKIEMLDTVIYKGSRFQACGKLDVGIHVKSTHQGTSLSHRSAHFPKVHTSWPTSRMLDFSKICTNRHDKREAEQAFLRKLSTDCPEHPMVACLGLVQTGPSAIPISGKSSWLVLPYNPCWRNAGITKVLSELKFLFAGTWEQFFPRISWKNGGRHLWRTV